MEDNEAKRRRLMERMGGPGGSEGFNGGFSAPPVQRVAPTAVAVAKPVKKAEEPDREDFVMNSNEAVCFRLVHTEADLETAEMFNPEFTHQVFREDETIFGFKELEINVYMHAVSFHTFIDIQHKGTAPTQFGPPDNIEARLKETFPGGYTTDKEEFKKWLKDLGPSPSAPGSVKAELYSDASGLKVVQLDNKNASARALHSRIAPFVLFEIDGGQLISLEEDQDWEVLLCLVPRPQGGHSVSGFFTVYRFQTLPGVTRLRLSQLVVLHPFRRRGHAGAMIDAMRALALRENAVDYTVEDPTDAFQKRRDVSDVAAARKIPEVAEAVKASIAGASAGADDAARVAALGMPQAVGTALREKLRLCRTQQRKVWAALLFTAAREAKLDPKGPAALAFREWTIRRLQKSKGGESEKQAVANKLLLDKEEQRAVDGEFLTRPGFLMCRAKNCKQPAAVREEEETEGEAEALAKVVSDEFDRLIAIAAAVVRAT